MSKPIRRHNRGYSGGFPLAVGDRMYAQDLFRDSAYYEAMTGIAYNDLTRKTPPYILNGLICVQGTGHTMTISAGKAVVPFQVTIPHTSSAWALPPTTTNANIDMVLDYAGGVDLSLAGTTTDGATPNYVKLSYTETNGNTRTRAKKAGSYNYEVYDTVTVLIDAVAPTSYEVNICTFTTNGATVTITNYGDSRVAANMQKYNAVVYSQATFNECIIRVAANQYQIRSDITSIYFKYFSGGYLCYGGTSFLSGGDTWGYIQTNNCVNIIFEKGAFIQTGNTQAYLFINTDDCYLLNVDIRGLGTAASAIQYSFLLDNTKNRILLENCKTLTRLSNTIFSAFASSSVNITNKLINCIAYNLESSDRISGFDTLENLINCQSVEITGTGGDTTKGFKECNRLLNCSASTLVSSSNTATGFSACKQLSNCKAETIDHTGAVAGQSARGFSACYYLSNCYASDIDTNGAGGDASGFNGCMNISSSYATLCNEGFNACQFVSESEADNNSGNGFLTCLNLSSCNSKDNGGDGFDGCLRISVCTSITNTGWGFIGCKSMHSNRSSTNTAGQYNTSYADYGVANPAADTAAGGYNA